MPLIYFSMIETQGQGMPHTHMISFNLYGGYDPRADMHIHYDPRRSYLNYLRRRQGLPPGAIYRSVDEGAPVVMCIFEWIIDNVLSPGREQKAEGWPGTLTSQSASVGMVCHEVCY